MRINFNDLKPQWEKIKESTMAEILDLFENSSFINGPKVSEFEEKFSDWNKSKFSIGVSNGTDGLEIAARCLDLNDNIAIYIPSNTFIATFIGMYKVYPNADYFLVDCDLNFLMNLNILEDLLKSNKNKYHSSIVVPVHLYGATVEMKRLLFLKENFNFKVIEDCSQAHGAITNTNSKVGNDGDLAVFSLYPGKNLGAAGDAAVITTQNENYFQKIKKLRNLGMSEKYNHELFSGNHRLDSLQAIILSNKLNFFDEWSELRINVAQNYLKQIDNRKIKLPMIPDYCLKHVFHIFCVVVEDRDSFVKFLNLKNIPHIIHYPIPLYKAKGLANINFRYISQKQTNYFADKIISLPIHPFMKNEEILYISNQLNKY